MSLQAGSVPFTRLLHRSSFRLCTKQLTGLMLILEMLYFENIWVWSVCSFYCARKLLMCSVSCSGAVVRSEGGCGHATGRTSSSWIRYCVASQKRRQAHWGEHQQLGTKRFMNRKLLDYNTDRESSVEPFRMCKRIEFIQCKSSNHDLQFSRKDLLHGGKLLTDQKIPRPSWNFMVH
jgi:hypothetical protein